MILENAWKQSNNEDALLALLVGKSTGNPCLQKLLIAFHITHRVIRTSWRLIYARLRQAAELG